MRNRFAIGVAFILLMLAAAASAQKDLDDEPTSWISFVVTKEDNGRPVRNAAVIMHPVNTKGRQERGGLELKTDAEGKANLDGIPYGKLRIQVLAKGFQTYGEDFDVKGPKTDLIIKLKRPQGQYSIYDDRPSDQNGAKTEPPPPAAKPESKPDDKTEEKKSDKPNN